MREEIHPNRTLLFYAFLFCLVNLLLINGTFLTIGQEQPIPAYIQNTLLVHPAYADSWEPMYRGLNVFYSGDDPTIYQKVFFDQKHKFQYPPTSLLIIDGLGKTVNNSEIVHAILNWISWFSVLGTILFSAMIFMEGIRIYVPEEFKDCQWKSILLILISGFTFYPILRGFMLGQIQVWLNFLFALALWFWIRNKREMSGVCLGLTAVIKPQMGLFLVWAFIRRQWKFCISLGTSVGIILMISLWRYGLAAHVKYLEVLQFIGNRGETYFPNQSVNGLANRLLFTGNNLEWEAFKFAPQNDVVQTITFITSIVLIGWVLLFNYRSGTQGTWIGFVTAGLVFTLASPVAWEHHYGILLPIFALTLPKVWSIRQRWPVGMVWVALAYLLTANYFPFVNNTSNTYWNFLQSYVFFGGLILLGVLVKLQLMEEKE